MTAPGGWLQYRTWRTFTLISGLIVEEGEVEQRWAAQGFAFTHHFLGGERIHPFLYQSLHVVLSEVFALLLLFEADEAWRIALLPLHQLILRVGWRTLGPVTTQTLLQVPTQQRQTLCPTNAETSDRSNLRFSCFYIVKSTKDPLKWESAAFLYFRNSESEGKSPENDCITFYRGYTPHCW